MLPQGIEYFIELKHKLESERSLLAGIPRDNGLVLNRLSDRIVAAPLTRQEISSLPCEKSIIKKALNLFDSIAALDESADRLRHTFAIVFDRGEVSFVGLTWDDAPKIAMAVFTDSFLVLDEQM